MTKEYPKFPFFGYKTITSLGPIIFLYAYDCLRQKECDNYDRLFVYVYWASPLLFLPTKRKTIFDAEGNPKTKSHYIALIIWLSKCASNVESRALSGMLACFLYWFCCLLNWLWLFLCFIFILFLIEYMPNFQKVGETWDNRQV